MRVLFLVRPDLSTRPGGDTTQILMTAQQLRARGVSVMLADRLPLSRSGFDLIHLFHLDRLWENLAHCVTIRSRRQPAVLSPIYWPTHEFDRAGRTGLQGLLARLAGSDGYQTLRLLQRQWLQMLARPDLSVLTGPWWSFYRAAKYVLETVQILLPNSQAELEQIERHFGLRRPAVIVPNAIDTNLFRPQAAGQNARRDGVLCVGRIEPRKNQLALIRALHGTGIRLTLVGGPGRFAAGYARRCQRQAGPNVHFAGYQPPAALPAFYQAAKVHACVSWYETPGLASLEAAACGCAIVVSPGGCTREYFGTDAFYCQPDDPQSIRSAVLRALESEPPPELTDRVRRDFTWELAAERTLEGYYLALELACQRAGR
jgi:glycosyltransferase involved in cell wall biosynthesis